MDVSPKEVQAARAFLFSRHSKGFRVSPQKFAAASKELGVGFRELLGFIGRLYAGGQQSSLFRQGQLNAIQLTGEKSS